MTKAKPNPRKWSRNHRNTTFDPAEILIAGQDFASDAGDPLRDPPSKAREALDPDLLDSMREAFWPIPVVVTPRMFGDEQRPVCVMGRRRVRHARVVNDELEARGEPRRVLICAVLHGDDLTQFLAARSENRYRMDETHVQIADSIVWLRARGQTDAAICKALCIKPASLRHYAAISDPNCTQEVRERLDDGLLPLQGASAIARLAPSKQREALAKLGDGKATATEAQRAAAQARNETMRRAPGVRTLRAVLAHPKASNLSPDLALGLFIAVGDVDPRTIKELAAIWPKDE